MSRRSERISMARIVLSRHLIETRGKLLVILAALSMMLSAFSLYACYALTAEIAEGSARSTTWTPEYKAYLTSLNPITFATIANTDLIYKAFFSIAMIFVGLIAWRAVGVSHADGIHKYFLLGGRSRVSIAASTIGLLAMLVVELVALVSTVNLLLGFAGYASRIGTITLEQVGNLLILDLAAIVPLLNYAIFIALLARLHMPRIALLTASVVLPILFGVLDTLTKTKYGSPWGTLSFFMSMPSVDATFLIAMAVELAWLVIFLVLFIVVSAREEVTN